MTWRLKDPYPYLGVHLYLQVHSLLRRKYFPTDVKSWGLQCLTPLTVQICQHFPPHCYALGTFKSCEHCKHVLPVLWGLSSPRDVCIALYVAHMLHYHAYMVCKATTI